MSNSRVSVKKINTFFEGREADVPSKMQVTWDKAAKRGNAITDSYNVSVKFTDDASLTIKSNEWMQLQELVRHPATLSEIAKRAIRYIWAESPGVIAARRRESAQFEHDKVNGRHGPR